MKLAFLVAFAVSIATASLQLEAASLPGLTFMRLPNGGVQPQAAVDATGIVHLIYLTGPAEKSDVFYMHSNDGGLTFSKAIRVNSQPGSAMAIGTVRGAHLAAGRDGRMHVAWMGSSIAEPKGPEKLAPMLYSRSNGDGRAFEPQRNLIQAKAGVDGGGSVAADANGKVCVAWHAPAVRGAGEQSRQVWLVESSDDGRTFSAERSISDGRTGACGCCGMRLLATTDGHLYGLYRTANQVTHRDMTLLRLDKDLREFHADTVGKMEVGTCIMSTAALAPAPGGAVAAWETNGQIYWAKVGADTNVAPDPIAVAGASKARKHPAIAVNSKGQTLLVWTEGTAWNRGGTVAWQLYDATSNAIGTEGKGQGLAAWGAPAAFGRADGTFVIVY